MFDSIIHDIIKYSDKGSFKVKEKILFFKELGNLLKGWVGISEWLEIIHHNSDNYAIKEVAQTLRDQIIQWKNFSKSLLQFPQYFDETDIATIQSGESSWNLDDVLVMIGNEYSYIESLKKKFIGALTYPIILITISLWAIIALFTFILPAIFEIANQFNSADLPWVTRTLKNFSDYLSANSLHLWLVIWFIWFAIFVFFSTEKGQIKLFRILFEIPVLGGMIKSYYLIRFSRYMKMLLESGINYIAIFKIIKNVIPHPIYAPIFEHIINWLTSGSTIYDAIKDDITLIPNNMAALIKVGEQTANLPRTFETIITIYQEELDHYIANISKVIEPIMLIFVGGIVVMIALWVFWIITHIMDSISM